MIASRGWGDPFTSHAHSRRQIRTNQGPIGTGDDDIMEQKKDINETCDCHLDSGGGPFNPKWVQQRVSEIGLTPIPCHYTSVMTASMCAHQLRCTHFQIHVLNLYTTRQRTCRGLAQEEEEEEASGGQSCNFNINFNIGHHMSTTTGNLIPQTTMDEDGWEGRRQRVRFRVYTECNNRGFPGDVVDDPVAKVRGTAQLAIFPWSPWSLSSSSFISSAAAATEIEIIIRSATFTN